MKGHQLVIFNNNEDLQMKKSKSFYFGLFLTLFIASVLVFQSYKPSAQKLTPFERTEVKERIMSQHNELWFEERDQGFKLKDNGRYIRVHQNYRTCVKDGRETEIYWYNVYAQAHSNSDDMVYDHTITAYQGRKEIVVSTTLSKGADSEVIEIFCSKW